jgi:hypothetical protein
MLKLMEESPASFNLELEDWEDKKPFAHDPSQLTRLKAKQLEVKKV